MHVYNKEEKGDVKYWREDTKILVRWFREGIIEKVSLEKGLN